MRFVNENSSGSLTDEEAMKGLAEGEIELLGVIYRRYDAMVKSALNRTAPEMSTAEIEEISQEVFLTVADKAPSYREQASFKAWLYSIAVRKAQVWRRNTWLRRRLLSTHQDKGIGMALRTDGSSLRRIELRESISKALSVLPAGQRDVLILHAVEGFNSEEISRILNIKPKTVRTRLHRARKRMLDSVETPIRQTASSERKP
jgi:RNA polymerase sigma-70 factor (ECF subfamily)